MQKYFKQKFLAVLLLLGFGAAGFFVYQKYFPVISPLMPVRVGYFHGLQSNMLYRAYINKYFEDEGVDIKLYTKFIKEQEFFEIPKSEKEIKKIREGKPHFGATTGIEIADKIMKGDFDGGTIGAMSFVASVSKGVPLVAVAALGYDAVSSKAIIMRNDVKINSPDDFRDKTLSSRRSGPGGEIFLRMFLEEIGLVPNKDITIINQVDEDDAAKWFKDKEKTIDGGLYHLPAPVHLVLGGFAYVYRPMDWVDPRLTHALLVFRKDYVANHREEVQKVINAYVRRIAYEKNLPDQEKNRSWDVGLVMENEFQGMQTSVYDMPPVLKTDVLQQAQDLLFKYNEIDRKVNLNEFLDYSFVENSKW